MGKIKGWTKIRKNVWENESGSEITRIFLTYRASDDFKQWFVFVKRKRFEESWDDSENIVSSVLPYRTTTKEQAMKFAIKYMRSNPNG